ncbi:MAG: tRNA 2-thiocytidine(32) synthetase TtcA [Deltaproteobacteria bacterium]|nr:MAG: tRNA 2-thiocytidine(32) synthetase TtcA [Deltaproteobacteria bacterium]
MTYVAKEMKRLMGKAISNFQMIGDGDRILVAVSGGQDSLSLLWLLRERLKRIPINYNLIALYVNLGFKQGTAKSMKAFFKGNAFDYRIIESRFGPRAHGKENRENPCFLCSRLRRKLIFEKAAELECNKIALGHQKDDFIETFFLNLFFAGSLDTIQPMQELFNGRLSIIRPLCLLNKDIIKRYADQMGFPEIDSGCPTARSSKRAQIRSLLLGLYQTNRKIRGNIFNAVQGMAILNSRR